MAEFQLQPLIRTKHKECWQKWHGNVENSVYKKMSIRTVGRYSTLLRQRALDSEDSDNSSEIF